MSSELVLVEPLDAATSLLTLNRPDRRNALTADLMQAFCGAMEALAARPEQRIAIVRGAGPAFCSGLDLQENADIQAAEQGAGWVAKLFETVACSPLVTIAAAHGAAYAGGAGLLASCDFAVAAADMKLAFPEVRRGLVPALVAVLLSGRVREGDARELFLLGEPIGAERARDIGLVHRVVPADQVLAEARQLAATILKGAPGAVRETRRHLRELRPADLSVQLAHALENHKLARRSPEATEGLAAFLERREPVWPQ